MWTIKRSLLALLFCLLFLAPGLCWAAPETVTMTIQEYNESMTALSELKAYMALSTLDSDESSKLLLQVKQEANRSLMEAERLLVLWKTVSNEKEIAQETVRQLRNELSSLKTTFARYIKENKKKRNSIGAYASTTSVGVYAHLDSILVLVGKKYDKDLEVAVGINIIKF